MAELKRILLPTDFSEFSMLAGQYARQLAKPFAAEIHLLHVTEDWRQLEPRVYAPAAMQNMVQEFDSQARQQLTLLLGQDWAQGQKVSIQTRAGSPAAEIMRYAEEAKIDMIIMSTHGRTGLAHTFIGSVAERVVRQSPCPVLTIRPQQG